MGKEVEIIIIVNVLASAMACSITGFISMIILNRNGYKVEPLTSPFTILRNLKELIKSKKDLRVVYYSFLLSIIYGIIVLTPFLILISLVILKNLV